MTSRREFLTTVSAICIASGIAPAHAARLPKKTDMCGLYADRLAEAMQDKYGGLWAISINEEFVLISRRLPSTR